MKIKMTREDLVNLRRVVVDQNKYIDLLLEWMESADAEIERLQQFSRVSEAVRVLNDHDMHEEAEKLLRRVK